MKIPLEQNKQNTYHVFFLRSSEQFQVPISNSRIGQIHSGSTSSTMVKWVRFSFNGERTVWNFAPHSKWMTLFLEGSDLQFKAQVWDCVGKCVWRRLLVNFVVWENPGRKKAIPKKCLIIYFTRSSDRITTPNEITSAEVGVCVIQSGAYCMALALNVALQSSLWLISFHVFGHQARCGPG